MDMVTGFMRHTNQIGVSNDTVKMQWTKSTSFGGDVAANAFYRVYGDKVDGSLGDLLHSQAHSAAAEFSHDSSHASYPVAPGDTWYENLLGRGFGGLASLAVWSKGLRGFGGFGQRKNRKRIFDVCLVILGGIPVVLGGIQFEQL